MTGRSRVTVFEMFGTVYGYATHSLDGRNLGEVAVVGPLSPGVGWARLWEAARAMNKEAARPAEHAQWIMAQANRAFVCGSGRIARFDRSAWTLAPGGRRARFEAPYCNRDELWTGDLTVPDAAPPDQLAPRPDRHRS